LPRRSREKHRDRYNAARRKPQQDRACEKCGAGFSTSIPHKRFCGKKCRKRADKRRNPTPRKTVLQ